MPLVNNFEELTCWQLARQLVSSVYQFTQHSAIAVDFEIRNQLRSAALSCMNNIAEGFGRRTSRREFIRFLNVAQASALEVKSMTYVLNDSFDQNAETAQNIREQVDKLRAHILALIKYLLLQQQKEKGLD